MTIVWQTPYNIAFYLNWLIYNFDSYNLHIICNITQLDFNAFRYIYTMQSGHTERWCFVIYWVVVTEKESFGILRTKYRKSSPYWSLAGSYFRDSWGNNGLDWDTELSVYIEVLDSEPHQYPHRWPTPAVNILNGYGPRKPCEEYSGCPLIKETG